MQFGFSGERNSAIGQRKRPFIQIWAILVVVDELDFVGGAHVAHGFNHGFTSLAVETKNGQCLCGLVWLFGFYQLVSGLATISELLGVQTIDDGICLRLDRESFEVLFDVRASVNQFTNG